MLNYNHIFSNYSQHTKGSCIFTLFITYLLKYKEDVIKYKGSVRIMIWIQNVTGHNSPLVLNHEYYSNNTTYPVFQHLIVRKKRRRKN